MNTILVVGPRSAGEA